MVEELNSCPHHLPFPPECETLPTKLQVYMMDGRSFFSVFYPMGTSSAKRKSGGRFELMPLPSSIPTRFRDTCHQATSAHS